MPIYEKCKLSHMDITVEELGNKHQLNPSNNGVQRIDDCLAYHDSSKLFRCDLMGIRMDGNRTVYKVTLKRGNEIIPIMLSDNCKIMNSDNKYVSIEEGSLKITSLIKVVSFDTVQNFSVLSIAPIQSLPTYWIRTSRYNYVTSSGIVVKSD